MQRRDKVHKLVLSVIPILRASLEVLENLTYRQTEIVAISTSGNLILMLDRRHVKNDVTENGGRFPGLDSRAAEFGRRRRILCLSRKSAEKKFG